MKKSDPNIQRIGEIKRVALRCLVISNIPKSKRAIVIAKWGVKYDILLIKDTIPIKSSK